MGIKTRDTININNAATNPDYIGRTALAPENGTLASPTIPDELEVTTRFSDVNSITFDISPFLSGYNTELVTGWNIFSYTVPYDFHLPAMLLGFFYPEFFESTGNLNQFFPNGITDGVKNGFFDGPYPGHSFVEPRTKNVHELINEKMLIIKNFAAQQYWPEYSFNGIGDFTSGEGYEIRMREDVVGKFKTFGVADIAGVTSFEQYLEFQNELKFDLPAGNSTVGYNRITPKPMDEAFAAISHDILIVKNRDGQIYWPEFNFNGIGDIEPGKGYFIKMNNEVNNFTFPPDDPPENIDLPFVDRTDEPNLF